VSERSNFSPYNKHSNIGNHQVTISRKGLDSVSHNVDMNHSLFVHGSHKELSRIIVVAAPV
jgi:hypothetical protein